VPHQVLVGIAEYVVPFRLAAAEIEVSEGCNELGQAILHLFALAELSAFK